MSLRFALSVLTVLCSAIVAGADAARRPNVVVVLIDDMGWADLSCFGNTEAETPNIDRLAAEGMRFTQFYVNMPICSPSRTALATGQYPQRWRITSFLNNRADNERRGMAQWLDPVAPVLARQLKAAGYATGHFGKWHMGGQRDVGEAPLIAEYGFDASLTNFEGLGPRVLPLCYAKERQEPTKHALGSDTLGRGPIRWEDRSRITRTFVNEAVAFINKAAHDGRPFYINLWPDDVHSPFFPPLDRRNDEAKRALYLAVLEAMDEQLEVLFDRIRHDEALRDNTLVLLMSDNGPEPGAGSAGPFRGGKGQLYEGGIRSPLIVWGPGLVATEKRGATEERAVFCAADLVPSLMTLTGVEPAAGVEFDGQDVSETLLGRSSKGRTSPLFWRRPPDRPGTVGEPWPDVAVRDGQWKLLADYDGANAQLHDLVADRSETTDVAGAQPEVVARLREAVLAWNASLPPDNGPEIGPEPPRRRAGAP